VDPRVALITGSGSGSSSSQQPASPIWTQGSGGSAQGNANQALPPDSPIPRMIIYTRLANLGLSICMIVASLLSLLTTTSATTGVLACYVMVFSCLLCCFETHLKQISKFIALNFGFMYSAKARSVFMIFVGTILFSFSLFGMICGILMLANAACNIYILFKYPGFEDAQRSDAQSEIVDFLSNNPAFSKSIVTSGAALVAQNPDVAANLAKAYVNSSNQNNGNQGPRV
jgi:hypothetical protein